MEEPINQSTPAQTPNQTGNSAVGQSKKNRMYPELVIPNNTHPNKLYAFPILGLIIKLIMLIPVLIVSLFVSFIYSVLLMITPFVILFSGKYWDTAYKFAIGYFTYTTKIQLFLAGLTDKYPGFTLEPDGIFEIHLPKPESPSRLLAFPVFGYLVRILIMIPYYIYLSILSYGMYIAIAASWFGVWIKGYYPESLYEFIKDEIRVSLAYSSYPSYLSDTYPSFKISLNHKKIKILLIILGIIILSLDFYININNDLHTAQHPITNINPAPNSSGSDE